MAEQDAPAAPTPQEIHQCCCRIHPGQENVKLRWEIHPKVRKLILVASDGQEFLVDEDAAYQSILIRKMVENLSALNGDGDEDKERNLVLKEPLPLSTITAPVLKKIFEWCYDHRKENYRYKKPHEDPRVQLTRYDEEYMDVDSEMLVDMLLGADYLDIPGLIDILCQKIANIGNGKSVEELRHIYMLEDDMTDEQKEEVKRRFAWVEA